MSDNPSPDRFRLASRARLRQNPAPAAFPAEIRPPSQDPGYAMPARPPSAADRPSEQRPAVPPARAQAGRRGGRHPLPKEMLTRWQRFVVRVGATATSVVALAGFVAGIGLMWGAATGHLKTAAPALVFVGALLPLGYGVGVAFTAWLQFRLLDADLLAPKALAVLLICPAARFFVATKERAGYSSSSDVRQGLILAAVVVPVVLLSLAASVVLQSKLRPPAGRTTGPA